METKSQPFSTLCCCTNFRECPNPPDNSEQNECRRAGYRKIQITESVNNLSVDEPFDEHFGKLVSKRVSKDSLDMNPEENNHHHVPHIRVRSSLHDEYTLIQSTREVQQLQRFHEVINLNTQFGGTPPERKQKKIKELLEAGRSFSWVKMAIQYGYLDVLKYFINKGEEINKVGSSSHILTAVSFGQLEIVEYLVELGLKDKDKSFFIPDEGNKNEGLIHEAVRSSNMDEDTACKMIELLLSKGEDPDGWSAITPLKLAVDLNKLHIAKIFEQRSNLKKHCSLSVSEKKEFASLTALQKGIEGKKKSDIKSLRKQSELDAAMWMQMASRHGFLDVLKYFVGEGKKVCKKSFQAPIWSAVSHGQFEIVEYLTDPKRNGRKKTYYKPDHQSGIDALINAAVQSTWMDEQTACRMIQLLLDKGEPVNGHGKYTPLVRAEALNKTVIVDFLKKEGGLNIQQPEEKVCDDMPAPPHDDPAEPQGACGYSPTPSTSPADPEGNGYFSIPPAPPAYDSLEYRLYPPGAQTFDEPPPSYEESMRMDKNPE